MKRAGVQRGVLSVLCAVAVLGCTQRPVPAPAVPATTPVPPAAQKPEPDPGPLTEARLHELIKAKNPAYNGSGQFRIEDGKLIASALVESGVTDLSPLAGQPLMGLDLMATGVRDLSPLKGMPLESLSLDDTRV